METTVFIIEIVLFGALLAFVLKVKKQNKETEVILNRQPDIFKLYIEAFFNAADTVKLVKRYEQAIQDENYELAGELHKEIQKRKNENKAHNG